MMMTAAAAAAAYGGEGGSVEDDEEVTTLPRPDEGFTVFFKSLGKNHEYLCIRDCVHY